jgi:hypothetical protein
MGRRDLGNLVSISVLPDRFLPWQKDARTEMLNRATSFPEPVPEPVPGFCLSNFDESRARALLPFKFSDIFG